MKAKIIILVSLICCALHVSSQTSDTIKMAKDHRITEAGLLNSAPQIIQIKVVSITPCDNDSSFYDAVVDVFYEGSTSLHAYLEEEESSFTPSFFSDSPSYTRLNIKNIDSFGTATLFVILKNEYGTTKSSITLSLHPSRIELPREWKGEAERMEVYNLFGQRLGSISSVTELTKFQERVFILKRIGTKGEISVTKYMVQ